MKIAVMGAGGIGGYVGGRLAQAGQEVSLIARGPHLAALQADGLRLDTPQGVVHLATVRAYATPAEIGTVDLVLFTVKLTDAEAAAQALGPLMGPGTRVLTLQNGIDSAAILQGALGPGRVSAGIIYLSASIKAPGVIAFRGGVHRIVADAMAGDPVMAELSALGPALIDLDIEPTDAPQAAIWGKFVNLAAFSGITCLTRSSLGVIRQLPASMEFLSDLLRENLTVARACGVTLPEDHLETAMALLAGQPGSMKSSMLIDLEADKPLELPWLSGRVCALAAEHGIDVPANRAVVAALAPFVTGVPLMAV